MFRDDLNVDWLPADVGRWAPSPSSTVARGDDVDSWEEEATDGVGEADEAEEAEVAQDEDCSQASLLLWRFWSFDFCFK